MDTALWLWTMNLNLKEQDLSKSIKLISQYIDYATCAACCKLYIAPETAPCGHSLCHTCWTERPKCVSCPKSLERHSLKHNRPLQKVTEDAHTLNDAFEKLFNIKVAEFMLEVESDNDASKNVRDWLASSQNHFSAPIQSSDRSSPEKAFSKPLNVSSNKIQIHTNTSKVKSPTKVMNVPNIQDDWDKIEPMPDTKSKDTVNPKKDGYVVKIPQDDWDKIEIMPDTEDVRKDKENIIGPMDIEPFCIDINNEYTHSNPRRSSRKRDLKPDEKIKDTENKALENQDVTDSTEEIDKKSNKGKQPWINVKRMRKEFSKLNKKNRGKLNVSIEMCKKTQNTSKPMKVLPQGATNQYDIDENTPQNFDKDELKNNSDIISENKNTKSTTRSHTNININANNEDKSTSILNNNEDPDHNINISKVKNKTQNIEKTHLSSHQKTTEAESHTKSPSNIRLPFYKKSSLRPKYVEEMSNPASEPIKATHHDILVDSNANSNDDIEITIKVSNTITNIVIKRKNEMELKINSDRGIQTSLDPLDTKAKTNSSKNSQSQNIVINVGENNEIQVNHQPIVNPRVEELKKAPISNETDPNQLKKGPISNETRSNKKNTDSADTASAHFEITESVEKELSKVMDFEEDDKVSKSASNVSNKKATKDKSQKLATQPDLEYLNDLDIFDSESVKESDVHLLKNTEHAPSEILLCTVKTKSKTQRLSEKRRKTPSDEDILPKSKKVKTDHVTTETKQNPPETDSMTYDAIMDTVFANIDADMEEIQSQKIIKNTYTLSDKNQDSQRKNRIATQEDKGTQEKQLSRTPGVGNSSQIINNCNNQKDSENIFSMCAEKEMENVEIAPSNKKAPVIVPASNVEEFLTPVMSQAAAADIDDSDRSVVEETPQKTSFTKAKPKSNGANKEDNYSQVIEASVPKRSSASEHKNSIINLTDTTEAKSDVNLTAVNIEDNKPTETPLNDKTFYDRIQHKSTPLVRKSLNFDTEGADDLTLCATNDIAKTTQEKEFMIKAFEKTPTVPAVKKQSLRSLALKHKKYVIAGSCLTPIEIATLKKLCARNKWTFVDKYTKDLTHLVVGVDEENKAQRSVKYMCALASSVWIISYEWVEKSMQSKDLVYEEPYEALDSTGDPGPRRSRISSKKLFQGISFYCKQPFSVLDVDTLKGMIESAGGRVVDREEEVCVSERTPAPAILLAEPENTQEDQFIYLAMQLKVVPVNYEWVLNCLGSYTLSSIQELLLCPTALLPKPVENWPQELLARDDDE